MSERHRYDDSIWIAPARRSGEPCIGGTRVPVDMVVNHVWEFGVDSAMDMWSIERGQVLVACWYAAVGNVVRLHGKGGKYVPKPFKHRTHWAAWARDAQGHLWGGAHTLVPNPPTHEEVS